MINYWRKTLFIFLLMMGVFIFASFVYAWDISTASDDSNEFTISQDGTPFETQFKSDGTKMYVLGYDNDTIYQYSLSSAWDVSTASYDSVSFSVNTQESVPEGLFFKPDGSEMYVIGVSGDDVNQYTLSTPWDLSTASYASLSYNFNSKDSSAYGITFRPNGSKLFLTGASGNKVYRYSVAGDVTNPTLDSSTPADGATDVAIDANIVLTFDEEVDVETGNVTIKKNIGRFNS